jgi:hypothetical protein
VPSDAALEGVLLPSTLPAAPVPTGWLVVTLGDPGGTIARPPVSARLTAGELVATCTLTDDGEAPDAEAGDRIHGCALAGYPRGEVLIELTDADGGSLWKDLIPIEGYMASPRISALLTGTRVMIAMDTVGEIGGGEEERIEEEEPSPVEEVVDPMAGEPPPGPTPVAPAPELPRSAQGAGFLALLGAAGLGFAAGLAAPPLLRRLRRRRGRMVWVGATAATPGAPTLGRVLGQRQLWALPDSLATRQAMVAIARVLAGSRPVLVVPRSEERADVARALTGAQGIFMLRGEQPEARELLRAAKRLGQGTVLLVQGHAALEQPLEDEEPDAVVLELLEDAPAGLDLLILAEAVDCDALDPSLTLARGDAGLLGPDGAPLLVPGHEGAGLVVPLDPEREAEPPSPSGIGSLPALLVRGAPPVLRWLRPAATELRWAGALRDAPTLAGLPPIEGQRQAWLLPDDQAVLELSAALIGPLAARGPLLLAPRPDGREALEPALTGRWLAHRLEDDRPPDPRRLLRAAKGLARAGRGLGLEAAPVLLVQGQQALEPALEDEQPDAVIRELLADAPEALSVLVLCTGETLAELEPSATLERDEQGRLCVDGAPVLPPA